MRAFAHDWPCRAEPAIAVDTDDESSEECYEQKEEDEDEDSGGSSDEEEGEGDDKEDGKEDSSDEENSSDEEDSSDEVDSSDEEDEDEDAQKIQDDEEDSDDEKSIMKKEVREIQEEKKEKNDTYKVTLSKYLLIEGLTDDEGPDALQYYLDFAIHCDYLVLTDKETYEAFVTQHPRADHYRKVGELILGLCYVISSHSFIGIVVLCLMELTPSLISNMTQSEYVAFSMVMAPVLGDAPGSLFRLVPQDYTVIVDVIVESIIPSLE